MSNFIYSGYSALSTIAGVYQSTSPSTKKSIEAINFEGFTSAMRIAMFPYAPDVKLSIEEFAINFDFPYKLSVVDTKSVIRYWNGEGRKNFIVIKRIARIMLDLFPPIQVEKDKSIEPITNCYLYMIDALQFIKDKFFSDQPTTSKIPNPDTFDFEWDKKKHVDITERMAGEAIVKTINLFKYCCYTKQYQQKKDLTPLQIEVRNSYHNLFILQFSNGLDLLKTIQDKVPISTEWLVEHEFNSLNELICGRIAHYQKLVIKLGKLIPCKSEELLFCSNSLEEKNGRGSQSSSLSRMDEKNWLYQKEKNDLEENEVKDDQSQKLKSNSSNRESLGETYDL